MAAPFRESQLRTMFGHLQVELAHLRMEIKDRMLPICLRIVTCVGRECCLNQKNRLGTKIYTKYRYEKNIN